MTIQARHSGVVRGTFWAAFLFYFLIGLEFIYMATPFALYFYSVYRPGLDALSALPSIGWLAQFFLPHLSITTDSWIVNGRNEIGIVLAAVGFVGFCISAGQTYYHKVARKGIVTRGMYRRIRHPQYASLMLCSFGLLVLWPRYLALLSFCSLVVVYYLLAQSEEQECLRKFGQGYAAFRERSGMFLPVRFSFLQRVPKAKSRPLRIAVSLSMLTAGVMTLLLTAVAVRNWSARTLYGSFEESSATISLTAMAPDSIRSIVSDVLADNRVGQFVRVSSGERAPKFLNYIVPFKYYALEIPMTSPEESRPLHFLPGRFTSDTCKVILTQALVGPDTDGKEILLKTFQRKPIAEAWYDVRTRQVVRVMSLSSFAQAGGVAGPVF